MTRKRLQKIRAMLMASCMIVGMGGVAADITAPVLSSPTGVSAAPTTATVGATTDSSDGTLYTVVSTIATAPTSAQIIAGHDSTGGAPTNGFVGSVAVVSTGAKTINATGLSAALTYYAHSVHKDVALNVGNVVSSAAFATYYAGETLTVGVAAPSTGGSSMPSGTVWLPSNPMPRAGTINQIDLFCTATGTCKIKRFRRSGATYTFVDEQSVAVVSGLNTLTVAGATMTAINVLAGDVFGFYSSTTGAGPAFKSGGSWLTPYYSNATDNVTSFGSGLIVGPADLVWQFKVTITVAAAASVPALGNILYIGEPSISIGNAAAVATQSYIERPIIPFASRLETLQIYSTGAGYAMFFVWSTSNDALSLIRVFSMYLTTGTVTYTAGVDFPRDVHIPVGGRVGHWDMAGTVRTDSTSNRFGDSKDANATNGAFPNTTETSGALWAASSAMSINITSQVKFGIRRSAAHVMTTTKADYTFATSIHPSWKATNWSIVGGKARNSGTGSGNKLYWRYGTKAPGKVTAWVTFSGGTDKIALFRGSSQLATDTWGTAALLDVSNSRLDICIFEGTTPTSVTNKTSSLTLVTGRLYKIELSNLGGDNIVLTVTDTTNSTTDSLTWAMAAAAPLFNYTGGRNQGDPGIYVITGTVDVSEIKFETNYGRALFYATGDSITDAQGASSFANGWAGRVNAALSTPGQACISAIGGGVATDDLTTEFFSCGCPPNVAVLTGTNDTVAADFQLRVNRFVEIAAMWGDTALWFGTPPPEAADTLPELSLNPYLRANYSTKVIAFDYALTTGRTGLGADRIAADFSDALHPSNAGTLAMYNEVVSTAPGIFTAT